ncbi:MAG: hypothetical protein DRP57_08795, partial [Spirochaetes bacterium]
MFSLKSVRRVAFFIFLTGLLLILVVPAFSEKITAVYDGAATEQDAEWWNLSTTYSANWTDDIDWASP